MKNKSTFRYEHKTAPLIRTELFVKRLVQHGVLGIFVLLIALLSGVAGYHYLENLSWIDSILNASMILGGMGPVDTLKTDAGKLFASAYAIFSGVVFLVVAGIMFTPVIHRMLHRLHIETEKN